MDAPSPAENIPDKNASLAGQTPPQQEPEKHIRTFAGDMDALKKADGTPHPPLGTIAPPVPPPAVPPPPPAPAPAQPSSINILNRPQNTPLQTYSGDFSDRMKATHASTATILAAEQDRGKSFTSASPETPSRSGLLYTIAGASLFVLALVGGYAAYRHYQSATTPIAPATVKAPIFVDEQEEISGTGPALLQAVTNSVNRPLAAGTIRLLYTSDSATPIFLALPVSIPDVLARNITGAHSMAGVINVAGKQSPFFILSVSSYSPVFSGLLSWEPLMPGTLADLFPAYPAPAPVMATSTTATTTAKSAPKKAATTTAAVPSPTTPVTFVDTAIASHDVRAYRDASGRDILVYGFWNQATLVIARDTAAFAEIVGRLATAPPQ